jgi:Plasmid pRiA4b ORF-3-like protein
MLCLGWMRQFKSKMQTIEQCPIDEFQAHAEQYLRRVQRSQVPLFVTDPAGPALVIMPVGGLLALQQQQSMAEPIVRRVTPQQLEDDRLIEKGVYVAPAKAAKGTKAAGKARSKKASRSSEIYQIKMTLRNIRPPVWRRVLVPSDFTLGQLHQVIQTAMGGWIDYHLHEFDIAGTPYGVPLAPGENDWGAPPVNDESRVKLADIVGEGSKFRYTYDFGDDWDHDLVVEKVLPIDPKVSYPVCIKAKRACPPEDCGGPWGYAELVEILADPAHEEYEERLEWVGGRFDPEAFDVGEINSVLATIGGK